MHTVGDRVVYGIHGVCDIIGVEQRQVDRKKVDYFVLSPVDQSGARFYVPMHNQAALSKLRKLLTPEEIHQILTSQDLKKNIWIDDENKRKQYYRELISSGDRAAILRMIHNLYQHKQHQAETGRKFHLCDENFLNDAQKLLRGEFAVILDIPQDQVGEYILKQMQ